MSKFLHIFYRFERRILRGISCTLIPQIDAAFSDVHLLAVTMPRLGLQPSFAVLNARPKTSVALNAYFRKVVHAAFIDRGKTEDPAKLRQLLPDPNRAEVDVVLRLG